jgi:hypothetical protein
MRSRTEYSSTTSTSDPEFNETPRENEQRDDPLSSHSDSGWISTGPTEPRTIQGPLDRISNGVIRGIHPAESRHVAACGAFENW